LFGRPKNEWSTIDEMIYKLPDFFNNSSKVIEPMRFKVVKESLHYHYNNSRFYNQLCKEYRFTPDEIKTYEDFKKVPLLPDTFFKAYPKENPRDVFDWLKKTSTIDIGVYDFKGKDLQDFLCWAEKRLGGLVNHSSGTTGHYSFMFRDKVTFQRFYYAMIKTLLSIPDKLDDNPHYVYPGSPNTFLTIGRWLGEGAKVFIPSHRHFLTEREISITIARLMSTGHANNFKEKLILRALKKAKIGGELKMLDLLKDLDKKREQAIIITQPYQLINIMNKLKQEGVSLDLGKSNSVVFTSGGWRISKHKKIQITEFSKMVEDTLCIPSKHCIDVYGMSEMNGLGVSCEGGYKHLHPWIHPMILDDEGILDYDNCGRFAFLDPVANSYPGFIATGDRVKLLNKCPECDKEGPVLDADITRMQGA
jgi:phenylacetate-coenzyme A ligase PaaK-like adenylate-forming protein